MWTVGPATLARGRSLRDTQGFVLIVIDHSIVLGARHIEPKHVHLRTHSPGRRLASLNRHPTSRHERRIACLEGSEVALLRTGHSHAHLVVGNAPRDGDTTVLIGTRWVGEVIVCELVSSKSE